MSRFPKNFFFDLDGTLLDSLPGITQSVDCALAEVGLPKRDCDLRGLIGPPIRSILRTVTGVSDEAVLDELEKAFRASYDGGVALQTSCFSGAAETLKRMKDDGSTLYVVSNKPRSISLQILEREGILPLFESIWTRDSIQPAFASKAHILEHLLTINKLDSFNCMMVGDTMEDAGAAKSCGVRFAFLEHGYGTLTHDAPVELRLQDFADFQAYLSSGDRA